MSPEQADDSRLARGVLFGFIFSIPVYLVLRVVAFYLWKLVFG